MGKNTENYNLILHNTNDFENCLKGDLEGIASHDLDVEKHNNFKEGIIYCFYGREHSRVVRYS